jgi:hypothetical protein
VTEISFKEMLTDALRYWEKRRVPYNAVLLFVVSIYAASAAAWAWFMVNGLNVSI